LAFPSQRQLKKVLKELENVKGTRALPEYPTALQKFRWNICQQVILFKRTHQYTQKHVAELAGIDEAKISKILHHRIDEFSTDRLISIYEKLNPNIELKVSRGAAR
jgi:predicted XRE-type DNA-binding protein